MSGEKGWLFYITVHLLITFKCSVWHVSFRVPVPLGSVSCTRYWGRGFPPSFLLSPVEDPQLQEFLPHPFLLDGLALIVT